MAEFNGFWYQQQLRQYLVQFLAVFADMKVQVGWQDDKQPRLITVPIKNASEDRIVADILAENTQNKMNRLPIMSATLSGIQMAPERRKGVAQVRRSKFLPTGGLVPNDLSIVEQRMPVPYILNFDLAIWASNQDQHYQILEHILTIFDPILHIQTDDDVVDWTRLTTIELMGIQFEENPPGPDRRLIQTTISFDVVAYMTLPVVVHNRIVEDIFVRVGAVSQLAVDSEDYIAELNQQGIQYEPWFLSEDFDFPDTT